MVEVSSMRTVFKRSNGMILNKGTLLSMVLIFLVSWYALGKNQPMIYIFIPFFLLLVIPKLAKKNLVEISFFEETKVLTVKTERWLRIQNESFPMSTISATYKSEPGFKGGAIMVFRLFYNKSMLVSTSTIAGWENSELERMERFITVYNS